MKILWITNVLFNYHNCLLGEDINKVLTSGSWLNAAFEQTIIREDIELHIATSFSVPEMLSGEHRRAHFYILPGGSMFKYDCGSKENIQNLNNLRKLIDPDVLIIWGTESRFSWLASRVFSEVPKFVYMQGVLNSIVEHYYDGVPDKYRRRTLRDYLSLLTGTEASTIYSKHIPFENDIIANAQGVIVENDWCEIQCLSINSRLRILRDYLPIRQAFYQKMWTVDKMTPYTIFTNAGGSPIKGHHILFEALALVKKVYPQVKLFIPGDNYLIEQDTLKRRTGYLSHLLNLYNKYKLKDNVLFTGVLSAEEMSSFIESSNVYVMPSLIENHSSSLIEAMIVGAPSISSFVGGTANLIKYGVNGYLYNSLEAKTLAGYIIRLFNDPQLASSIGSEALKIRECRQEDFNNVLAYIEKYLRK